MQDLTPYLSAALPDVAAIHAMVAGERSHVSIDGKAVLLHDDFTPWVLTNPPNPADTSDISDWVISAHMDRSAARDVTTQCDLILDWALGDQVNTLRAYIQFFTVFYDESTLDALGNPAVLAAFPRCIVGFQIPDRSMDDQGGGDTLKITGYDIIWRIRDLYLQNTFVPPAGMPVTAIVEALLQMDNATPSEGGRQPSGHTSTGPHSQIPVGDNRYATPGVFAHTVCTVTDVNGYLVEPGGLCIYNPDASILVDPVTHFPIDPWTCLPMTLPVDSTGLPIAGIPNTFAASTGLWFSTHTGAFYRAGYTFGFESNPVDPFRMAALPVGLTYYHPDPAHPTQAIGNVPCPLESWPYDWDGSGTYYQTGGAGQTTSGGGTTSGSSTGPTTLAIGAAATIGKRDGSHATTVISAGTYTIEPAGCSNDPALAGHMWCQPQGGLYQSQSAPIAGYDWPAGTWTVSLTLTGAPLAAGQARIAATLYKRDSIGNLTLLATCPVGSTGTINGAGGIPSVTLSCSGPVGHIVGNAGDTIVAEIALTALTALTCDLGTSGTGFYSVNSLQISYPAPTITNHVVQPVTISGGNGLLTPSTSGTRIPWPDSNNPGLCPTGCETPGPNIPLARINATPSTIALSVSSPYNRDTNFLDLVDQLLDASIYRHLYSDEVGIVQLQPQPLFSRDGVPDAVWSFRTDAYQAIKPPLSQKVGDQAALINKLILLSQNNNRDPMMAMATNQSLSSAVSIPNLGRTVMGKPIQDDKIPDMPTLLKRLELELQRAMSAQEALDLTVADVPFLQLYDPIDVYVQRIDGTVVVDAGPYAYFISAIQVDLMDPTSMKITAGRAAPV